MNQLIHNLSDNEVLSLTLIGEARGEPIEGIIAVGCVIRIRMHHSPAKYHNYSDVCLEQNDIDAIRVIHGKYYADQFSFPDFFHHFLCSFVVENDEKQIVAAGGVRLITESVLITDKSLSAMKRVRALRYVLGANRFIA